MYVYLQNAVKPLLMSMLVFNTGVIVRHVCIANAVHVTTANIGKWRTNAIFMFCLSGK